MLKERNGQLVVVEFVETKDGDEEERERVIPSHFEVCERCCGRGVHDHSAFANGISGDEFAEDPDFFEDYRAGTYDVTCERCHGKRVVLVPDDSVANDPAILAHNEAERERAYERRMRERGIEF